MFLDDVYQLAALLLRQEVLVTHGRDGILEQVVNRLSCQRLVFYGLPIRVHWDAMAASAWPSLDVELRTRCVRIGVLCDSGSRVRTSEGESNTRSRPWRRNRTSSLGPRTTKPMQRA